MSNNKKLMIVGLVVLLALFVGFFLFSNKENYTPHAPPSQAMNMPSPQLRDYDLIQSNDTVPHPRDNFDLIENEPEEEEHPLPAQSSKEPREFISASSQSGDYEML